MPLHNPVSALGAGNGGTQLGTKKCFCPPETSRQRDGVATGTGSGKLRPLRPPTPSFFHLRAPSNHPLENPVSKILVQKLWG